MMKIPKVPDSSGELQLPAAMGVPLTDTILKIPRTDNSVDVLEIAAHLPNKGGTRGDVVEMLIGLDRASVQIDFLQALNNFAQETETLTDAKRPSRDEELVMFKIYEIAALKHRQELFKNPQIIDSAITLMASVLNHLKPFKSMHYRGIVGNIT
jgi:hypothetical protein